MRDLQARLENLQEQLLVAQETLRAIRSGEVDALVVGEEGHEQLYTLQTAEQPYRILVEAMQQGALTVTRGGDVLYCNRYFSDLVGLPPSQVSGAPFSRLLHPDDEPSLTAALTTGLAGGAHAEVRLRASARLIPVHLAISPFPVEPGYGFAVVVTDLTEHVRQRDELLFVHNLALEVARSRHVDEALELVVKRLCARMGWTAGSAWMQSSEGRLSVRACVPAGSGAVGDAACARSAFDAAVTMSTECGTPDAVALPVQARDRIVAVVVFNGVTDRHDDAPALHSARAALAGLGAVIERKQVEEELLQSLTSQEELLYTIAHDLRSPNRAINGYASLLLDEFGLTLDPQARDYLDRICNAAKRNDELIVDLLEYGGLAQAPMPLEPTDLRKLVEDAWARVCEDNRAQRGSLCVAEPLPTVLANGARLRQVLVNLLDNACSYGGDPALIQITAARAGDRVKVSVRDEGPGIPEGQSRRVFQPFTRLASASGQAGTGMGLAIVRRAIERMGGEVGVEPPSGRGACFWFDLMAA